MKKKMVFTIDGDKYEMAYEISSSGKRIDVTITDENLKKVLTDNFTIRIQGGKGGFILFGDKQKKVGFQILEQLKNIETGIFN